MEFKNEHLTRQSEIIPQDRLEKTQVTIVGCGAIGSFLALGLAKTGVTDITVYDFDTIEIENMNNQFFRFSDIGKNKAVALADLVRDFTGVELKVINRAFEPHDMVGARGLLVTAVDSMSARSMLHEAVKTKMNFISHVIDPRMSAEFFALYTFDPADSSSYVKTLYTDSEAVAERCTAKSTAYTAMLASGYTMKNIKNIILGESYTKSIQWDIKQVSPFVCWANKTA